MPITAVLTPEHTAWFKNATAHLPERIEPHRELLKRHDLPFVRRVSGDPGKDILEDAAQIAVAPYGAET